MKVLVDTHVFLWAILEPAKLSRAAKRILEDPETVVRVSSASAWEIAIKVRSGQLPGARAVVASYAKHVARLAADELPMNSEHALLAGSFRSLHRDPFDRMLAAQAHTENLRLMTSDSVFTEFPVDVIW